MMPGGISYMGVVSYFGQDILDGEGVIDKQLSKIVFSDKENFYVK